MPEPWPRAAGALLPMLALCPPARARTVASLASGQSLRFGGLKVSTAVVGSSPSGTCTAARDNLTNATGCSTVGGYNSGSACDPFPLTSSSATTTISPVSSLSVSAQLGAQGAPGQTVVLSNSVLTVFTVPEPGSLGLLAAAGFGLLIARRRTKRAGGEPPPRHKV